MVFFYYTRMVIEYAVEDELDLGQNQKQPTEKALCNNDGQKPAKFRKP